MTALTICPWQKLMQVLAVISIQTFHHTSQEQGTRMVNFNFRRNHSLLEMGFRKGHTFLLFICKRMIILTMETTFPNGRSIGVLNSCLLQTYKRPLSCNWQQSCVKTFWWLLSITKSYCCAYFNRGVTIYQYINISRYF